MKHSKDSAEYDVAKYTRQVKALRLKIATAKAELDAMAKYEVSLHLSSGRVSTVIIHKASEIEAIADAQAFVDKYPQLNTDIIKVTAKLVA